MSNSTLDTGPFREYADLELEKRRINARLKEINGRQADLKPGMLEALDAAQLRNVPLAGLATVGLRRAGWAKVVKADPDAEKPTDEDKARAAAALKAAGLGDYVAETFNTHSVSALYREWDKNGEAPPPELAGVLDFEVSYDISVRAAS